MQWGMDPTIEEFDGIETKPHAGERSTELLRSYHPANTQTSYSIARGGVRSGVRERACTVVPNLPKLFFGVHARRQTKECVQCACLLAQFTESRRCVGDVKH